MGIELKRRLRIFGFFVQVLLILFLVITSATSFSSRMYFFTQKGVSFFSVKSGSMEPTIPVGSVVYVAEYKPEELKKGDIITFSKDNSVVTHRIEKVIEEEEVKTYEDEGVEKERALVSYKFVTKGDANNSPDKNRVSSSEIIGKYEWHVPKIGYLAEFVKTRRGFLLGIVLPAMILVVWELVEMVLSIKKHYQEKAIEEIERYKKTTLKNKK